MKTILRSAAIAVLLSAGGSTIGAGQAINACYVPAVGAIYLVGLPGLPTGCLTAVHTAIALGGGTTALLDGAVTAVKLADGAVITIKLADGSVTTAKLAANAVGAAQIADNAVGASEILADAVGSAEIAAGAVGSSDIATGAVGTLHLADGSVTAAKLAPGTIPSLRRTVIQYNTGVSVANPGDVPEQLRVLGTFSKLTAGSDIEIVWNSHVAGAAATGGGCNFHIRVDGAAEPSNDLGAIISGGQGYNPVSTTNLFTNLGAGTHTISLWVRGVGATSCMDNPGNYARRLIVTEYQP